VREKKTWDDAKDKCRWLGSDLVSIYSEDDNEALKGHLKGQLNNLYYFVFSICPMLPQSARMTARSKTDWAGV